MGWIEEYSTLSILHLPHHRGVLALLIRVHVHILFQLITGILHEEGGEGTLKVNHNRGAFNFLSLLKDLLSLSGHDYFNLTLHHAINQLSQQTLGILSISLEYLGLVRAINSHYHG